MGWWAGIMLGMKRIFALLGLAIGLIAAALMLSASARGSVYILGILAGLGLLYGSYLIFRGKTSLLFGCAKTRTRALGGRRDQTRLLQESEGVADLVLREVQELGEADNPDRLVLHDRLEHRDMALEELDFGLNLASECAPPAHGPLPLHSVSWAVITWPDLKGSTRRGSEERHRPIRCLAPSTGADREDADRDGFREQRETSVCRRLRREPVRNLVVDE